MHKVGTCITKIIICSLACLTVSFMTEYSNKYKSISGEHRMHKKQSWQSVCHTIDSAEIVSIN